MMMQPPTLDLSIVIPVYNEAESLLNDAPPNAIVLSNWHWANPMCYLQQVEGLRTNVSVQYVFPRDEALATTWLKSIETGPKTNRPGIVDMFFHNEFNNSQYFFSPISSEAYQACLARRGVDQTGADDSDRDVANRDKMTR